MAVLNKIRQRSVFLILIIALALFAFILADLFRNSSALSASSQNIVATINDIEITRQDFLEKVEATQRQLGPNATTTQAMNLVWEQELRNAIMEGEYNKLGLIVERDQLRDILKTNLSTNPQFQNEAGLFDEGKLNEYIANIKLTSDVAYQQWINYENSLAESALQKNYFNFVKGGVTGTILDGKLKNQLESSTVDFNYVQLPYASIPDSTVTVTKSEIENYIKNHKDDFEVEAKRDINYVEFLEKPSAEDETEIKNDLEALKLNRVEYNEATATNVNVLGFAETKDVESFVNTHSDIKYTERFQFKNELPEGHENSLFNLKIGEIYGPYKTDNTFNISKLVAVKQVPDSAKARHILIPYKGAVSAGAEVVKTKEEARKTADSVLNIVKRNRAKFPELVTKLSSDQGSINNGGRYDWFPYNRMVPKFRDYVFDNKVGDIGVIETDFGFHVIEIEGQTDVQKAIQLATISREIEPSEKTIDNVFRDASNFEINLAKNSMKAIAEEEGLTIRPVNGIGELQENIPGLNSQRQIVRWAFNTETKVGDFKRFNIPNGFVIVQLTDARESGLMPVEDATLTVLPKLRKEKKAKLLIEKISNTTDLQALATAQNYNVQTALAVSMDAPTISGIGLEPKVVGYAFGMDENEVSEPIEGINGVYMIKLNKHNQGTTLDNYTAYSNQVTNKRVASAQSDAYVALKDKAEIEDNRAKTIQ